jgi:phage shock protein PspC (stress-responsive transcriptional regulator)
MQKVVIVNLNGNAYHLEEGAYAALGAYLERAEAQLHGNPDRAEIIADLEQAIADKFGRCLGPGKNVVTASDMQTMLDEMGPVHDASTGNADRPSASAGGDSASTGAAGDTGSGNGAGSAADAPGGQSSTTKRLYRMLDTGVVGGVCSGLATFFDTDVTFVRIGVTLLALLEVFFVHTPLTLLAYLAALFIVPPADTSEERAAARGIPFSAQQLIDEAKRNFSRIGERDWKDTRRQWRQQRRWERKYQRQMRRSYAWPQNGSVSYGSRVALGVTTPVATVVSVCAFWAMAYIALSLASTGAVHGWTLPAGVPLWLGLLGLLFFYNALVWPLHFWRKTSYYRLAGPDHAGYQAFDGLMSVVAGIAIVWAAYHYRPEVREWLQHLPEAWHNVVASFNA